MREEGSEYEKARDSFASERKRSRNRLLVTAEYNKTGCSPSHQHYPLFIGLDVAYQTKLFVCRSLGSLWASRKVGTKDCQGTGFDLRTLSLIVETRAQVLARGGFTYLQSSGWKTCTSSTLKIHVLVLCHTIKPEYQQKAIKIGRDANPRLQTVVMAAFAPEFIPGSNARFVSAFDGPVTLIAQVRQALKESHHESTSMSETP
jgi:hypothetical protein